MFSRTRSLKLESTEIIIFDILKSGKFIDESSEYLIEFLKMIST